MLVRHSLPLVNAVKAPDREDRAVRIAADMRREPKARSIQTRNSRPGTAKTARSRDGGRGLDWETMWPPLSAPRGEEAPCGSCSPSGFGRNLTVMTPEIWTILGTGFTLAALGATGFTLLWRYITRAEQRTRADLAAAEQRTRADLAAAEKRSEARFTELKADLRGDLATAEKRNEERFVELGTRLHTLEIQMAKLEGLLEGLREAITGKRAA